MYKFVRLEDYKELRQPLLEAMEKNHVRGTLLIADEGINGTVASTREGIDGLLEWLQQDERLADISYKESYDDEMPFYRTKVKLKKEIVTMGVQGIDPRQVVGTYVKPNDWNELISDPDVVLVDTRNDYEIEIGTFKGAVDPNTKTFREFPEWAENNLDKDKHKKVAMFCTGGIRCEKSTAYMKEQGFEEVYHLDGGILKYLEEVPETESLWEGECYVFDNRITVNHQLEKGNYDQCHACRMPITEEHKQSEHFVEGISCPLCIDTMTDKQRAGFAERQKQIKLAEERGESHIGCDAREDSSRRVKEKQQAKDDARAAQKKS